MGNLLIVGAGPIGTAAARAALEDGVVAAVSAVVDPDPAARRELETLTGAAGYASAADLPVGREGDRALVAFSSSADKVAPEIVRLLSAGYHVVTTCEELAWPARHIWQAMHTAARSNGRVVIVTGANPGFVMDQFPLMAATASRNVHAISVRRVVDTSQRRISLVEKTGRGLTVDEFRAGLASGRLGHKGLVASIKLLAHALGWPHHDVKETVAPLVSEGVVTGIHHHAQLRSDGRTIDLDLVMDWEPAEQGDTVHIDGEPPLRIHIEGGYHGDRGTTTQVVQALRRCPTLAPAFYRSIDLPLRIDS
jgi:4-hydroxy-tetrahydrodipicolinate reductase